MTQSSWVGKTLGGRYRIEERLGQGGMSAVYKAQDPNLRRVVAVKMIHPHLADNADFVRRFEEEAAAVAQLRHPNIIQVFDFNHDDDAYYMVLEFLPGETLQARLRRLNEQHRRMPVKEALTFIAQIADAVQYAHERGMVHRDIKPANIMLDVYGKAILMDFGIAKIMGGQLHTATGAVVGTAMYMSPEQITGEKVDERSDIYSLAVTLFECLSGRPPYEADSAMTLMMMHLNDPVPDLRALQPDLPAGLANVVERALQKKRDARYPSAAAFALALRQVLDHYQSTGAVATVVEPQPSARATEVERNPGVLQTPPPGGTAPQNTARTATPPPPPYRGQATGQQTTADAGGTPGRITGPQAGVPQGQTGYIRSTPPPGLHQSPAQPGWKKYLPLLIGGGLGAVGLGVVLLIVLYMVGRNLLGQNAVLPPPATQAAAQATATDAAIAALLTPSATSQPSATPAPTSTPAPSATPAPSETPTPEFSPTPTVPSDRPFVRINEINVRNGRFIVNYETFQYTEKLPGMHVHFFFNSVSPDQAGLPGSGPWILYGGPRPFTKYTVADKPYNATQMCALVANANHSVLADSGNCLDLPVP